ncbi:TPA: hypothetical protein N0F65_011757 [Lagenidium giganteum]|uniref:Reverse transcriptase/retrotransposon-derived protein RNase H-like domain-containing protein n=1 Tax=Lagenidium giganteum TaxID=4803 RepID=A0AAV2YRJ1_9STRA|nr:TPA: hypothetical protein N0F65_011757 [Lagenidium giganteum]
MDACDRWNLSISVPKSAWGKRSVEQLGHVISPEGIATKPKDLAGIRDLPFPTTLKALQSFLGSLNYYNRFIQNFAVHAAILYELRDRDLSTDEQISRTDEEICHIKRAKVAFKVLKDQMVAAPVLRHFLPDSEPVIITYACDWAVASTLVQDYEGIYMPVRFCSRVLTQPVTPPVPLMKFKKQGTTVQIRLRDPARLRARLGPAYQVFALATAKSGRIGHSHVQNLGDFIDAIFGIRLPGILREQGFIEVKSITIRRLENLCRSIWIFSPQFDFGQVYNWV